MAEGIGENESLPQEQDQAGSRALVERPGNEVASGKKAVPAQAPSSYNQELPYEVLVDNFTRLVGQARERHRQGHPDGPFSANEPFEPAEWLGWHLRKEAGNGIYQGEAQRQLMDLWVAWDALYHTRYPAENGGWRNMVRSELEFRAGQMRQPAITLSPRSVTIVDAMAEAAGLPLKRGEAIIDLTPFARPEETTHSQPRENKSITRRTIR